MAARAARARARADVGDADTQVMAALERVHRGRRPRTCDPVDLREIEAVRAQGDLQPGDLRVSGSVCGGRRGKRGDRQDDPEAAHQGGPFGPRTRVPAPADRLVPKSEPALAATLTDDRQQAASAPRAPPRTRMSPARLASCRPAGSHRRCRAGTGSERPEHRAPDRAEEADDRADEQVERQLDRERARAHIGRVDREQRAGDAGIGGGDAERSDLVRRPDSRPRRRRARCLARRAATGRTASRAATRRARTARRAITHVSA